MISRARARCSSAWSSSRVACSIAASSFTGSPSTVGLDAAGFGHPKRLAVFAAIVTAGLTLPVSASSASAPIKRLAWTKASAVWTAQAKAKAYAVYCSPYSLERGELSCIFYDPAVSARERTFVRDGRHHVYARYALSRYDSYLAGRGEPHVGCTYTLTTLGASMLPPARYSVVNVCERGWVAGLPRVP